VTDYYAVLSRAVADLDPNNPQGRRTLYDRARYFLDERLRGQNPPFTESTIDDETFAFEDAIDRIEAEFAHRQSAASRAPQRRAKTPRPESDADRRDVGLPQRPSRFLFPALVSLLGTIAVLAISAMVYAYISGQTTGGAPIRADTGSKLVSSRASTRAGEQIADVVDMQPGVDGGSTDSGLPFFYRRQAVYYRTVYTVGTLVIDRSQHFLYLVQPKIAALRYGIAVGGECIDPAGLHRISRKAEWPEWVPSPELLKRRAYPARMAGGPGNPLGARALYVDRADIEIHGTNAPKTIGHDMLLGCFRMVNDDVVDLYNRVNSGTAVVVLN
jgi:lipoprotein-anchoring transpeptidase ErfK/SrfK